ncbi:MAG: hypothetical protein EOS78_12610 [Mesorhizobium sp.]|nr:MAG: hypothetical protein EOS78_12610 [Mesorhizobium sp.]
MIDVENRSRANFFEQRATDILPAGVLSRQIRQQLLRQAGYAKSIQDRSIARFEVALPAR